MADRLTGEERASALSALPGWAHEPARDGISRSYRFRDFTAAWGFMSQVALVAERTDHHPEWSNVWNRVDVLLTTHSAGGLTAKDVSLAKSMDRIAAQLALGAPGD